jgi:hypothetical protein
VSKVVAFVGSPHKEGRTAQLVLEVLRGASEAGAEVKVYHASEANVGPCQSCFACRKGPECGTKDGMQDVLADVKDADAIVVGSPVYFCQVSSQAKMFLDRLFPLVGMAMTPEGPVLSARYPTKKILMAYAQNLLQTEAFAPYFDWMRGSITAARGAFEPVDDVILGGSLYPEPPGLTATLEKAYAAGQALA